MRRRLVQGQVGAARLHVLGDAMSKNPWGLTSNEMLSVETVLNLGNAKAAAKMLGIEQSTFNARMKSAKAKVFRPHRLSFLLTVDRWIQKGRPL